MISLKKKKRFCFCFSFENKEEFHENGKELGRGGKRLMCKTSVGISFRVTLYMGQNWDSTHGGGGFVRPMKRSKALSATRQRYGGTSSW